MVIKGNARGGAADLAKHLKRQDTNERVEIVQLRGVAANDLTGALKEMDAYGAALRTTRTLYHASINVPAHERLSPEQRMQAIDRLESALGLIGQPRVVVEHEKHGRGGDVRVHCHVVWSRTDMEHMRAIRCDHNFRTHELVARELEREFGHARVQGVHIERDGPDGKRIARPERTPTHAMMQQAERAGRDPHAMKAEITGLWRATDSGKSFAAALEQQGYVLARGDRRDFVVVDRQGEIFSLAKCVEGARAKDVRARMSDLDRNQVPDVAQARATQQARQRAEHERQAEQQRTKTPAAAREQGRDAARPTQPRPEPQKELPSRAPSPAATRAPSVAPPREKPNLRAAGEPAVSIVSGVAKGIGAALSVLEGLFSAPKPPTPEQAKQSARMATENEKLAAFRQHVAEQTQRHSTIVDQSRAQQRERDQLVQDRTARDRKQRDDDRTR